MLVASEQILQLNLAGHFGTIVRLDQLGKR
jgi:hypothetical protein